MADIFVSYTSSDRDWAFWIAKELEALGHVVIDALDELGRGEDAAVVREKYGIEKSAT